MDLILLLLDSLMVIYVVVLHLSKVGTSIGVVITKGSFDLGTIAPTCFEWCIIFGKAGVLLHFDPTLLGPL